MSRDDATQAVLWEQRYRELEETFALAMAAAADSMEERTAARVGQGISEVWAEVEPTGRFEVVALLTGPVQEVSFRVHQGGRSLLETPFRHSNTLVFDAPTPGRYSVVCTSRHLSSKAPLSQRSIEVIVR